MPDLVEPHRGMFRFGLLAHADRSRRSQIDDPSDQAEIGPAIGLPGPLEPSGSAALMLSTQLTSLEESGPPALRL